MDKHGNLPWVKPGYNPNKFNTHTLQKLMALFISDPINYQDTYDDNPDIQHLFFMRTFLTFAEKYYHMDPFTMDGLESIIFFGPLNRNKISTMNICGGGGKRSNSGKNEFKGFYNETIEMVEKHIKYLSTKYGFDFNPSKPDPRIFIGHQEIWKNPSPELLKKEGWEWIINKSYDDDTFQKPFPEELDKDLIPLTIRNKTLQMFRNRNRSKCNLFSRIHIKDELIIEELEEKDQEKEKSISTDSQKELIDTISTPTMKILSKSPQFDDWEDFADALETSAK